jgi:hypothetical protein
LRISSRGHRRRSSSTWLKAPGKFSPGDKRRYYLSALGSTTECAAILDVLLRIRLQSDEVHAAGKQLLERIAAILVKLSKAQEER